MIRKIPNTCHVREREAPAYWTMFCGERRIISHPGGYPSSVDGWERATKEDAQALDSLVLDAVEAGVCHLRDVVHFIKTPEGFKLVEVFTLINNR